MESSELTKRSANWSIAKNSDLPTLVIGSIGATVRHTPDFEWFSATDLFQASNKKIDRYLKAEGVKEFYAALAAKLNWEVSDLLKVVKGGKLEQGTWVHKRALMHVVSECSIDVKIWFFGEVGYQLLDGQDIKNSDAMASLRQTTDILLQPEVKELVASYETQIDKLVQDNEGLELLTDELANDLALKDHQLNQMKYFVEEADVLGRWQQENTW